MRYILKGVVSLVCFVVYITGYAAIYTFHLSEEFFYSTADKEPGYYRTIDNSESTLRDRLAAETKEFNPELIKPFASMSGDKKLIFLIKEKFLGNEMFVRFRDSDNETLYYSVLANGPGAFGGSCEVRIVQYNGKSASIGDSAITCDFRYTRDGELLNSKVFSVEPKTNTVFSDILYPENGIKEDLFYRMLYFSTVTATTLGFGEIVPLTNKARAWVAIESMTGLLLMGGLVFWTTRPRNT